MLADNPAVDTVGNPAAPVGTRVKIAIQMLPAMAYELIADEAL